MEMRQQLKFKGGAARVGVKGDMYILAEQIPGSLLAKIFNRGICLYRHFWIIYYILITFSDFPPLNM